MSKRLERSQTGALRGLAEGVVASLRGKVEPDRIEAEATRELIQRQEAGGFHMKTFSDILSSIDLNANFETVFIALHAIYRALSVVDGKQRAHNDIIEAASHEGEQAILKLLQDLRRYKILKLNPDFNDVRILQFVSAVNDSNSGLQLEVDDRARGLVLPKESYLFFNDAVGDIKPIASVTYLTDGVTGLSRKANTPEYAVDNSTESFWAETIYTQSPVNTDYDSTTYKGVIAQLTVDIKRTQIINRIDLKPFGEFPPRLLDLEVSTDGNTWTTVTGFSEPSVRLRWWCFFFEETAAQYIRATILQENFRKHTLSVPQDIVRNQTTFDHIIGSAVRYYSAQRTDSEIETLEQTVDENVGLALDAISELDTSIKNVVVPNNRTTSSFAYSVGSLLSMMGVSDRELGLRAVVPVKEKDTVLSKMYEYTFGLFHIEPSRASYHTYGEFRSPKFAPSGTLWEVALDVDSETTSFADGNDDTYPSCTVEYDIEVAPFRSFPILPRDTTSVQEVVVINPRTHTGYLRFVTSDSAPNVWANGEPLDSSEEFSFNASVGKLTIASGTFHPAATYLIEYIPTGTEELLQFRDLFSSFPIPVPDVFYGNDPDNKVLLTRAPFIDYEKINDTAHFYTDGDESRFHYRSSVAQSTIDGTVWGVAATTLSSAIGDSDTTISINGSTTNFTSSGTLRIDAEELSYSSKTANSFIVDERGINGTVAKDHSDDTPVLSEGKTIYDPLLVTVDGVRAHNLTDYHSGEYPVMPKVTTSTMEYSYIQAGNRLYFNGGIPSGKRIEVNYNVLVQYLRLVVRSKQSVAGRHLCTPNIQEAVILMNQGEI